MENSEVKKFEDKRWREVPQKLAFRHTQALAFTSGPRVLDIGCGDGLFLQMLREKGLEAQGVDMSSEGVLKCKEKGLVAKVADVSSGTLPFRGDEFDSVTLLDVLEHLYAPEILLSEARRVTKKEVIVSIPNFNSLPARLQVLFGRVPENNRPNKGHVYWFNAATFKEIVGRSGLKVSTLAVNTFFEQVPVVGVITKLLARMKPSLFALSFVAVLQKQ